jgi:L-lactate dehydrogenase complex protein LldG
MTRENFLGRVRQAAAAGRAYRVHLREDLPERVGLGGVGPDLVARMVEELRAVGGCPWVVPDHQAARQKLKQLFEQFAPRTALCWKHPVLDRLQLADFLVAEGIARLTHDTLAPLPEAEQRAQMLAADIGISSASWAIAEMGSLAMASQPGQERLASLLPPVHVAIIEAQQILPDLFDLFDLFQASGPENIATNVVLITGPSKTGDLELKLTTGVHGPGEWHVIVVEK